MSLRCLPGVRATPRTRPLLERKAGPRRPPSYGRDVTQMLERLEIFFSLSCRPAVALPPGPGLDQNCLRGVSALPPSRQTPTTPDCRHHMSSLPLLASLTSSPFGARLAMKQCQHIKGCPAQALHLMESTFHFGPVCDTSAAQASSAGASSSASASAGSPGGSSSGALASSAVGGKESGIKMPFFRPPAQSKTAHRGCSKSIRFSGSYKSRLKAQKVVYKTLLRLMREHQAPVDVDFLEQLTVDGVLSQAANPPATVARAWNTSTDPLVENMAAPLPL